MIDTLPIKIECAVLYIAEQLRVRDTRRYGLAPQRSRGNSRDSRADKLSPRQCHHFAGPIFATAAESPASLFASQAIRDRSSPEWLSMHLPTEREQESTRRRRGSRTVPRCDFHPPHFNGGGFRGPLPRSDILADADRRRDESSSSGAHLAELLVTFSPVLKVADLFTGVRSTAVAPQQVGGGPLRSPHLGLRLCKAKPMPAEDYRWAA